MINASEDVPPTPSDAIPDLAGILLDSLDRLARAGDVDTACKLAGRAYVALRHHEPQAARRFDVFLHRQIRHLEW